MKTCIYSAINCQKRFYVMIRIPLSLSIPVEGMFVLSDLSYHYSVDLVNTKVATIVTIVL